MTKAVIEVDTSLLGSSIASVRDASKGVESSLEGIYNAIRELDAMWEGAANEAFNAQFAADYVQFKEICAAIAGLLESMRTAQTEYNKCENSVSSIVNAVKID